MGYGMSLLKFLAAAVFIGGSAGVSAHEFWIAPDNYVVEAGQEVKADLLVGSFLVGEAYPWLTRNRVAAHVYGPEGDAEITGREGDMPALRFTPEGEGLHRVIFHSQPGFVVYDKPETFPHYLDYEGLDGVLAAHKARGLPETGFIERFVRNAKALVQAGEASPGQLDAATGMPFELTALQNPYVAGLGALDVALTWQGQAAADVQVAIFVLPPGGKAPDDMVRTLVRTDAEGRASVPLAVAGDYMLAAVHMEPLEDDVAAVWESHWATLTYQIAK